MLFFVLTYQPIPFYLFVFLAAGCSGTWRVLTNLFPVPCSPIFLIFLIKKKKSKVSNQFSGRFYVRFVATTMTTTGHASRRCKSTLWKDDENVTELYIFGRSWKIWSQIPMARSTPQPTSALVASAPSRNRSTQGSGRKSLKLAYPCKEQGYSTQCRSK